VFYIVKESLNILLGDMGSRGYAGIAYLKELAEEQERYILYCKRNLANEKGDADIVLEWELLSALHHLESGILALYIFASEKKLSPGKEILGIINSVLDSISLLIAAYQKKDMKEINRLNGRKKEEIDLCARHLQKEGRDSIIVAQCSEFFLLIRMAGSPVLSMILQKELVKQEG
jgi:hypothetical protein